MNSIERALAEEKKIEAYIERHEDDKYVHHPKTPDPCRRIPHIMLAHNKDTWTSWEEQYEVAADYSI